MYPQRARKWKKQKTYMEKRILCPPLRDKFTKFGDKLEKIAHNEANGMCCYKRTSIEGRTYYEVFKAVQAKDEVGNVYERYPSSSGFGFGTALCLRGDERHTADKIAFYMANGFNSGRWRPGRRKGNPEGSPLPPEQR